MHPTDSSRFYASIILEVSPYTCFCIAFALFASAFYLQGGLDGVVESGLVEEISFEAAQKVGLSSDLLSHRLFHCRLHRLWRRQLGVLACAAPCPTTSCVHCSCMFLQGTSDACQYRFLFEHLPNLLQWYMRASGVEASMLDLSHKLRSRLGYVGIVTLHLEPHEMTLATLTRRFLFQKFLECRVENMIWNNINDFCRMDREVMKMR